MSAVAPDRVRKYLSIDSLIQGLRERFEAIPDPRRASSVEHSQADCLMSAFAMFSLKDPSLLAFDQRRQDKSLMNLYRIKSIPSDTQHREILDEVDPKALNECFADIFYELQRGGMLKDFVFHDGQYLLAIDGTGYFCSTNISCPHCLVKNSKSGKTEYSHQMVAAVLVHPSMKVVIPIMEPVSPRIEMPNDSNELKQQSNPDATDLATNSKSSNSLADRLTGNRWNGIQFVAVGPSKILATSELICSVE